MPSTRGIGRLVPTVATASTFRPPAAMAPAAAVAAHLEGRTAGHLTD
jgi:hypothetical protein